MENEIKLLKKELETLSKKIDEQDITIQTLQTEVNELKASGKTNNSKTKDMYYNYKEVNRQFTECLDIIYGKIAGNKNDAYIKISGMVKDGVLTENQNACAFKVLRYIDYHKTENKTFDFNQGVINN